MPSTVVKLGPRKYVIKRRGKVVGHSTSARKAHISAWKADSADKKKGAKKRKY